MTGKTSTRTTTRKTTTAKKPRRTAAKSKPSASSVSVLPPSAPEAKAPTPKLVSVSTPSVSQPELKKRELIDMVVDRAGIKKKDAKPAIEAVLAILGEALAEGRDLNLRPLGKLRPQRKEEKANGTIIVCKLRQPKDDAAPASSETTHAAE